MVVLAQVLASSQKKKVSVKYEPRTCGDPENEQEKGGGEQRQRAEGGGGAFPLPSP